MSSVAKSVKDVNMSGHSVPIRKFGLDQMVANPAICMIAKRGSGKSWVVRSILKHFKDIPGGIIISPTDRLSSFYGQFFPDLYIHYEYRTEILQNIFERQRRIIKKSREALRRKKKVDPRAFVVMDDCLASKGSWLKDDMIKEMFMNGRHYHLMYILTMQFPLGITPELRTNFDYIFLLADDYITNQKRLYEHYAGMFANFDMFRQVYQELTKDYGCMVIVNRGAADSMLDKIFYYKSDGEEITYGSLGCDQFRQFAKDNYVKEKDRGLKFDMDKFVSNKSKPRIHVEKIIGGE